MRLFSSKSRQNSNLSRDTRLRQPAVRIPYQEIASKVLFRNQTSANSLFEVRLKHGQFSE